jgi:hypothetical protein
MAVGGGRDVLFPFYCSLFTFRFLVLFSTFMDHWPLKKGASATCRACGFLIHECLVNNTL